MSRFLLNKTQKHYILPAVAAKDAPTQAEITAGTDITGVQGAEELEDLAGFAAQPSNLPMPGYADVTVPTLPGEQTFPDSTLSFYEDDTDNTIETLLGEGTTHILGIFRTGLGVGKKSSIYDIQVGSNEPRLARNVPAIFDVNISIISRVRGTQA